jgi:hypothetical protein
MLLDQGLIGFCRPVDSGVQRMGLKIAQGQKHYVHASSSVEHLGSDTHASPHFRIEYYYTWLLSTF